MKYLLSSLICLFILSAHGQIVENVTINNLMISPVPLEQGGTGSFTIDFFAGNGATIDALDAILINISPTQYLTITGPPTSSLGSSSMWTWNPSSTSSSWLGQLTTSIPTFYSEQFTFEFTIAADATITDETDLIHGFNANLIPHVYDPRDDTDDNTFQYTYAIGPLAISLGDYDVRSLGRDAYIKWSTSSEENNEYFDIESSLDGANFERIATIKSKSQNSRSSEKLHYEFSDLNAASKGNKIYYRLKNVDHTGSIDYSPVKEVQFNENYQLTLYPNPVKLGEEILIDGSDIESVKIYSSSGKLVKEVNSNGSNQMTLSTNDLARGFYLASVNNVNSIKFVVE